MDRPASRPVTDETAALLAMRSPLFTWFMTAYMRRHARRRFHAVRLAKGGLPDIDPRRPVIVYANHPSWWDPLMFVLLQAHVFHRRIGYGPMEAQSLQRYGVLQRIGVFGLEPTARQAAARFLRVGSAVLQKPGTVLWVTAEGAFTDARRRPVRLRPGVAHLLRSHPDAVAVPLALEYPFWNESTPEALARFGTPLSADADRGVAEWDALLEARLTQTMERLADDAMTRDAARFHTIVTGGAGIGGVYDVWRRGRAALRGERPRLEHGQPAP